MRPTRPTQARRALRQIPRILVLGTVLAFCAAAPTGARAQVSENVDLLANVDAFAGYNDIWGYTAPGGDEFAIIGTTTGTAFYDVTVPTQPVLVGTIDGPDSIWRDLKTYNQHCYIVSEGSSPSNQRGLQIVSLVDPQNPVLVNTVQGGFNTAHNIFIDTAAGRAYVVGHDGGNGGMLIYDLAANPTDPPIIGSWDLAYIHDVYVKNNIAYAAAIYSGVAYILDVTNPLNIIQLNSWTYPGATTHATWTTEDQTVLVIGDETSGGHLTFWDVSDPGNQVFLDEYIAAPSASIHNPFIRNNICYASYYTEGLRVVSLADPNNVQEVGYYDTFQGGGLYAGAWGAYPFAAQEGIVYVSDIDNGLFVLQFNAAFGTVSGTVTDAATLQPIEGATVHFVEAFQTRTTGPDGTYTISLAEGTYTVEVSAFGYDPDSAPISVIVGQTTVADFALNPLPSGSLAGTVGTSGDTGIEGAMVTLAGTPLSTATNASGDYSFASVPAGSYTADVQRFRYAPASAAVDITAGVQQQLDFTLLDAFYWSEMETDPGGWTVTGNATTGQWTRVDPNGTGGGAVQPEDDHTPDPGVLCWVTGQGTPGGSIGENDVDGGSTILTTQTFDLSGLTQPILQYHRWYTNDAGSNPGEDTWLVEISSDGGAAWSTLESTQTTDNLWRLITTDIRQLIPEPTPLDQLRFRFTASDLGGGSIVEAGVDDFQIYDAAAGPVGVADADPAPGRAFRLHGNFPNPFNPRTTIRFDLQHTGVVNLRIFDAGGRLVRRLLGETLEPGAHALEWDGRTQAGSPAASGVYFYRLEAGALSETRSMVLAK